MIEQLIRHHPVIPVVTIDDLEDALPLAEALVAGGLTALEITLRTPVAIEAIRLLAEEVPGAIVGAGTVLSVSQYEQAKAAGAEFFVAPGATATLLKALAAQPFLPGVSTVSEMLRAQEAGFNIQKFFPAEVLGGTAFLRSIAGPLNSVKFCATGGIAADNMTDYLQTSNVGSVGGSWMMPKTLVKNGQWSAITELAQQAVNLAIAARPASVEPEKVIG